MKFFERFSWGRGYDEGYQQACRTRWALDAASAYMAGFHAGYQWDGTLDPDEDRDAYIEAEWNEYQARRLGLQSRT